MDIQRTKLEYSNFCHINFCQCRKIPFRLVEFTPANKRAASVKSPKNDARVKDPGRLALGRARGLERMHHVSVRSPILLQIWQPTKTQAVFGTKIKNSRNFTLPPYARLLFTDGKKSHYKRDTDLETCNERETCKEKRPRLKKVPVSQTCSSLSHCSPKLS